MLTLHLQWVKLCLMNIVRTKSRATGGITEQEKKLMDGHARLWIARAMRTDPIEADKIIPAIEGLYRVAGLKKPRVVIVPSPLVMAFAYGASAAIWHQRKSPEQGNIEEARRVGDATDSATDRAIRWATVFAAKDATEEATDSATAVATEDRTYIATDDPAIDRATSRATRDTARKSAFDATYATYEATYDATGHATFDASATDTGTCTRWATLEATDSATLDATGKATSSATQQVVYYTTGLATYEVTDNHELDAVAACRDIAGEFGIKCAEEWYESYQGGNMWAGDDSYLTACRDILGLDLKEHAAYAFWEQAAIHGGFRVMHEEFCLVSDFPELILKDEQDRPHCATGPSHRWRDGWALYHWHGTRIPSEWIENPSSLTPSIALVRSSLEQRRAACEILGWSRILRDLNATTIDRDPDPQIGDLVEVELPGLPNKAKFLRVRGTGREFAIGIPPHITKALDAQAWMVGLEPSDFVKPEVRT